MQQNLQHLNEIIKQHNIPIETIVEIGANNCNDSLDFIKLYPEARVYAFECNPETIPLCKENIQNHPQIHLIEQAVSDRIGTIDFYPIDTAKSISPHADGNPGASSLFLRNTEIDWAGEIYPQKHIQVQSTTLHEFLEDKPGIDLLWLDAQGSELMILKGAAERLQDIKVIQCEVEFQHEYVDQPLFEDVKSFLESNGFVFHGFSGKWEGYAGDAVFIHDKHYHPLP